MVKSTVSVRIESPLFHHHLAIKHVECLIYHHETICCRLGLTNLRCSWGQSQALLSLKYDGLSVYTCVFLMYVCAVPYSMLIYWILLCCTALQCKNVHGRLSVESHCSTMCLRSLDLACMHVCMDRKCAHIYVATSPQTSLLCPCQCYMKCGTYCDSNWEDGVPITARSAGVIKSCQVHG